jgi:hypothetical protein
MIFLPFLPRNFLYELVVKMVLYPKNLINIQNKAPITTNIFIEDNENAKKKNILEWFNKTVYPPIMGLFFLFLVTLLFLVSIKFNFIEIQNQISLEIPILSCVFFLVFPFIMRFNQKTSTKDRSKIRSILLLIFAVIVAIVLVFVMPFIALIDTMKLIPNFPLINNLFFFLIVEIIQVFLILLFTSSVSGYIAEIELKNTITNLTRINDEISNLLLNPKEINESLIPQLIQQFQTTKKYDVHVTWLLIFKTYSIIPNQIFLKKVQ